MWSIWFEQTVENSKISIDLDKCKWYFPWVDANFSVQDSFKLCSFLFLLYLFCVTDFPGSKFIQFFLNFSHLFKKKQREWERERDREKKTFSKITIKQKDKWLEAVGPMCCVMHEKEPSALIKKGRGSHRCSWSDWLRSAPQHLANHYMVLCTGIGLIFYSKLHNTLQENTECWSALSVTE